MANQARISYNKEKKNMKSKHQLTLHMEGKGETKVMIYTVQQYATIYAVLRNMNFVMN